MFPAVLSSLLASTRFSLSNQFSPSEDAEIQTVRNSIHTQLSRLFRFYGLPEPPRQSIPLASLVEAIDAALAEVDLCLDQHQKQQREHSNSNSAASTSQSIAVINNSTSNSSSIPKYFNPNVKPQIHFSPPVDNSHRIWLPILKSKPHANKGNPLINYESEMLKSLVTGSPELSSEMSKHIQSLTGSEVSVHSTGSARYEPAHPYKQEISTLGIQNSLIKPQSIKSAAKMNSTKLIWIDEPDQLAELCSDLAAVEEFAVDLEHHNYRSYLGFTCLMQISTRTCDYLIDTIKLRSSMELLLDPFADPSKLKIFHGSDMDMIWLQRDFGLYVVNLFDTGQAARVLELPAFGLAYALQFYCDVKTDKKYQLADWRQRPLTDEMALYARMDTHYLFYIKDRMLAQLREKSKAETVKALEFESGKEVDIPSLVFETIRRSRAVSLKTFAMDAMDPNAHIGLSARNGLALNQTQLAVLASLMRYRDSLARSEDESPHFVCPNHVLLLMADRMPDEIKKLLFACKPNIPPLIKKHSTAWLEAIAAGRYNASTSSPIINFDQQKNSNAMAMEEEIFQIPPASKKENKNNTAEMKSIIDTGRENRKSFNSSVSLLTHPSSKSRTGESSDLFDFSFNFELNPNSDSAAAVALKNKKSKVSSVAPPSSLFRAVATVTPSSSLSAASHFTPKRLEIEKKIAETLRKREQIIQFATENLSESSKENHQEFIEIPVPKQPTAVIESAIAEIKSIRGNSKFANDPLKRTVVEFCGEEETTMRKRRKNSDSDDSDNSDSDDDSDEVMEIDNFQSKQQTFPKSSNSNSTTAAAASSVPRFDYSSVVLPSSKTTELTSKYFTPHIESKIEIAREKKNTVKKPKNKIRQRSFTVKQ